MASIVEPDFAHMHLISPKKLVCVHGKQVHMRQGYRCLPIGIVGWGS
jgi:hypothetical protein